MFAPRLYSEVLMPKLGQRQAAEDALAETFRALLENLRGLRDDQPSLWPWLRTVASRKATDQYRDKARARRALTSFEELLAPLRSDADPALAHEADQGRTRLQQLVPELLANLNPRYRRAIELRFLQDRSRDDCAKVMELKLGTFDVLLLRALRAFRQEWDRTVATQRGALE
jgi:RNA polymerase sigma-70 factor (ECF subfamily)